MSTELSMLINGDSLAGSGDRFEVINPATGKPIASGHSATTAQLDQAVAAARGAFADWRKTPDEKRQSLLHTIADRIEANADELARIVVREQGKPLSLAQFEVGAAVGWTRYNADLEIPVTVIEDSEKKRIEGHRKPLGVVASITPWNWPLMIAIWHIMPALRTGNTVVCKPSGLTPMNTLRLVEIINEVLPAGVVNLVTGDREIGEAISGHMGIDKVIFTGSTPTGQNVMANAGGNLKHLTLELGGNDAAIVLPGTDVDAVAEGIFNTAFLNMGQTCGSLKRLYVHDSLYDALCDRLVALAEAQVLGDGLTEGVTFGPVQNVKQFNRVRELVDDARAQGARILTGGAALERDGNFYPPTIVADIGNGVRLVDEEQFGPALPVIRYSDLDEAIRLANDSPYGLGGSVWGPDPAQADSVAHQLECGTVWINGHAEVLPHVPLGGCKMSGIGVEFGVEGLLEYTRLQVVNTSK